MPDDDSFKIKAYRQGTAATVPCPRCGALVPAAGTMCPECGLHFRGPASEFAPEAHLANKPRRLMRVIALVILLGVVAAVAVGLVLTILSGRQ